MGDVSKIRAGVVLALAAMAGSDVPATMIGVIDSREWGFENWASDIVVHLAYGLVAPVAYDTFTGV